MSNAQYVASPGRSVLLANGELIRGGCKIPDGQKKKNIQEWLSTGFIRRVGGPVEIEEVQGVVTSKGDVKAKASVTPVVQPGKFNYNPNDLAGKSLDDLNIMLADLGSDPAADEKEAIGLLSADRPE